MSDHSRAPSSDDTFCSLDPAVYAQFCEYLVDPLVTYESSESESEPDLQKNDSIVDTGSTAWVSPVMMDATSAQHISNTAAREVGVLELSPPLVEFTSTAVTITPATASSTTASSAQEQPQLALSPVANLFFDVEDRKQAGEKHSIDSADTKAVEPEQKRLKLSTRLLDDTGCFLVTKYDALLRHNWASVGKQEWRKLCEPYQRNEAIINDEVANMLTDDFEKEHIKGQEFTRTRKVLEFAGCDPPAAHDALVLYKLPGKGGKKDTFYKKASIEAIKQDVSKNYMKRNGPKKKSLSCIIETYREKLSMVRHGRAELAVLDATDAFEEEAKEFEETLNDLDNGSFCKANRNLKVQSAREKAAVAMIKSMWKALVVKKPPSETAVSSKPGTAGDPSRGREKQGDRDDCEDEQGGADDADTDHSGEERRSPNSNGGAPGASLSCDADSESMASTVADDEEDDFSDDESDSSDDDDNDDDDRDMCTSSTLMGSSQSPLVSVDLNATYKTPGHVAHEIIPGNPDTPGDSGMTQDIWSLGVILFALLTSGILYRDENDENAAAYKRMIAMQFTFLKRTRTWNSFRDLVVSILRSELKIRPNLNEIGPRSRFASKSFRVLVALLLKATCVRPWYTEGVFGNLGAATLALPAASDSSDPGTGVRDTENAAGKCPAQNVEAETDPMTDNDSNETEEMKHSDIKKVDIVRMDPSNTRLSRSTTACITSDLLASARICKEKTAEDQSSLTERQDPPKGFDETVEEARDRSDRALKSCSEGSEAPKITRTSPYSRVRDRPSATTTSTCAQSATTGDRTVLVQTQNEASASKAGTDSRKTKVGAFEPWKGRKDASLNVQGNSLKVPNNDCAPVSSVPGKVVNESVDHTSDRFATINVGETATTAHGGRELRPELELLSDQIESMLKQESGDYRTRDYMPPEYQKKLASVYGMCPALDSTLISAESSSEVMIECWREKICAWSYEVVDHFDLSRNLVSVSIHYLDRFLATTSVDKRGFQLLAMASLSLAIKLFDSEGKLSIAMLSELSRSRFTVANLATMEMTILRNLSWRVNPPTACSFVGSIIAWLPDAVLQGTDKVEVFERARYLTELSVLDYFFVVYQPSEVALAATLNSMEEAVPNKQDSFSVQVKMLGSLDATSDSVKKCRERLRILNGKSTESSTTPDREDSRLAMNQNHSPACVANL